jgi:hypothetical protein
MGQGYATLDLSPSPEQEQPFEKLQRVILWREDDGDDRQVLLQWEDMPDFCRLCQLTGHCRADCPDYQKYLKCHNCNLSGHAMRNCPRNNAIDTVIAPSKKRFTVPTKDRKTPLAVLTPPHPEASVEDGHSKPDEQMKPAVALTDDNFQEQVDAVMSDAPIDSSSSHASKYSNKSNTNKIKQVNLRSPRAGPIESDLSKITKLDGNCDVSDSRNKIDAAATLSDNTVISSITNQQLSPQLSGPQKSDQ